MTISCEHTGNLSLDSASFTTQHPDYGPVNFYVEGHSQGLGGIVRVAFGKNKEVTFEVPPCRLAKLFGVEFWGEYDDHRKKDDAKISFEFP